MSKHIILSFYLLFFCSVAFAQEGKMQGRCLFVNDDWIESTTLTKEFYSVSYYHANPVLKADCDWELNATGDPYAAPFSGGVWYDEAEKKFKMWYSAGGKMKNGLITCYATSADGKSWTKPSLDIVPGTNIVDTTEHDCISILLDKFEPDPQKRYKMFVIAFNSPNSVSMKLKYSADGIHWGETIALSGELYDRCAAYYDPFRKKYVLSLKTINGIHRRSRCYLAGENPELLVSLAHRTFDKVSDKFIRYWFHAGEDDPRHPDFPEISPQIYNHEAMPYEGIMIGYFSVWQGPENDECLRLNIQKRNEVLVGWTTNGFDWDRKNKRVFIPVGESADSWNAGNIQSTCGNPLIVGDSLYFYVSGRYNSRPVHASNFATGLAMLRRDGFASMKSTKDEGFLLTRPFKVDGEYLFINADIKGKLKVEMLDEFKKPIKGFVTSMHKVNNTKIKVEWKGGKDMKTLVGRKIHLKFYVSDGNLYSFWISPWETGKSRGYTSGGGPGLSITGRDI